MTKGLRVSSHENSLRDVMLQEHFEIMNPHDDIVNCYGSRRFFCESLVSEIELAF